MDHALSMSAKLGDMLEVHIKDIELTMPFGYNRIRYQKGTLSEDFPYDFDEDLENRLEEDDVRGHSRGCYPTQAIFWHDGCCSSSNNGKNKFCSARRLWWKYG